MAKENGNAKKGLETIFAAQKAVIEAEALVAEARAKLNAAGEAWLKAHGAKRERVIEDAMGKEHKVEVFTAKPFVGDDGRLYEVRQRFNTRKGQPGLYPTVAVLARDLG